MAAAGDFTGLSIASTSPQTRENKLLASSMTQFVFVFETPFLFLVSLIKNITKYFNVVFIKKGHIT